MRNLCKECDYYHKENNTCQSKKCCTGGDGYITWIDRLFCKPYKYNADRKTVNSSEKPNNCDELNAYRECVKSRSFWDSKHCDGCYFDERCPFDEPKDEGQTEERTIQGTGDCDHCSRLFVDCGGR